MTGLREPPSRLGLAVAALAFLLSGASALVYQVAWQRILALHTGVGTWSVALIVAAFMAGLGLGSHLGGVRSAGLTRRRALLAFARLELLVAAFGAVSVPLYYDGLYARGAWLYAAPVRAGLLHFASLLPPTVLMGMSLPLLVRAAVAEAPTAGRTIGVLYATNMLGASLGALAAPWLLVRHFGLEGAALFAAGGNALAGVLALGLLRRHPPGDDAPPLEAGGASPDGTTAGPGGAVPPADESPGGRPFGLWLLLYAVSGFCALSLEILWFRLLDVATHSTAFTFGTLLSAYLLGSAGGCYLGAARASRLARPLRVFLLCQCALLAWSGLTVVLLAGLPSGTPVLAWYEAYWREGGIFRLGESWDPARVLLLYGLLPAIVLGPPTILMGFSFPALQRAVQDDPRTSGRKVGLLQAANIAGCVVGSLAVGLLALSVVGTSGSFRILMAVGVAFAAVGLRAYGPRSAFLPLAALLAVLVAAVPGPGSLWRRLHGTADPAALAAEDATGVGAVLPAPGGWHVAVNGKHHSWLPFGGVHTRLGAVPALVHPAPRDVAIVGLGSGDTAWAAGCRPETRSITVFEISGPQLALLELLARREPIGDLRRFLADPRLRVRLADGRHALATGPARYDLIEADALWPYAAGSGSLNSVEFFRECARALKPGGIMCTWTPTPRIMASFRAAFPHVAGPGRLAFLLGSNEPIAIDPGRWQARLHAPATARYLGADRVKDLEGLLPRLRPFPPVEPAGDGRLNRDLFPRDEFLAP